MKGPSAAIAAQLCAASAARLWWKAPARTWWQYAFMGSDSTCASGWSGSTGRDGTCLSRSAGGPPAPEASRTRAPLTKARKCRRAACEQLRRLAADGAKRLDIEVRDRADRRD